MLEHLQVLNLALTDQASITFSAGMSCITGETGAGKSLFVDALSLILGGRADTQLVKAGSGRLEVEACFSCSDPDCLAYLQSRDLIMQAGEPLIIRRTISTDGKSRAQINARSVNLTVLRELGTHLLSIHGQHAGLRLTEPGHQLQLLDAFGRLDEQRSRLAEAFSLYSAERQALSALADEQKALARDYRAMRHQQEQLAALALGPGDYEALAERFERAQHYGRIQEALTIAQGAVEGQADLPEVLHRRIAALQDALRFEPRLQQALTPLEQALALLEEGQAQLEELGSDQEQPAVADLEQRMVACHELARLMNVAPAQLHLKLTEIEGRLRHLLELRELIADKTQLVKDLRNAYEDQAVRLSAQRRDAAERMSQQVGARLQMLAMPDGQFQVVLVFDDQQRPSGTGRDHVSFMFAANRGQQLREISSVASGGELSRLALAIEVVTSGSCRTPTIVFDEVDSGISGRTATCVGQLLHELAREVQVLTVTHLPQVAACADHHFLVAKHTHGEHTVSEIQCLDRQGRIAELARLMGGQVVTDTTLQSAAELLDRTAGHA